MRRTKQKHAERLRLIVDTLPYETRTAMLDGLAQFDCTVYAEVEAGDHLVILLQLHAVEHSHGQPLIFHRSCSSCSGSCPWR